MTNQYTFSLKGTISFDVSATSEKEAISKADVVVHDLRNGMTADDFFTDLDEGYLVADVKDTLILTDTYQKKGQLR